MIQKSNTVLFLILIIGISNLFAQPIPSGNERITEYLEPTRILWKAGWVKNEVRLLKTRTGQADLNTTCLTRFGKQGHTPFN